MTFATDVDALTEDRLRERGSLKWTMFPDAIGAFVAEMDFGVAPAVRDAVTGALDRGATGYLPTQAATDLSAATAAWYADRYGWAVPPERVHHVPDVIAAFELAIERFSTPGSAVIVPTPAYMPFLTVPGMHDRRVIEVPSIEVDDRMVMDLEGVARAFADGGGLLVLCNPHNPLGTVFTRDELVAVSEVVDAAGGRVFSDEIHAPIVYGPARHVPYASVSETAAGHTLTAASASKAWNLAGLKCAQVILSNDADAAAWEEFGMWAGHGTSTIGVYANTAAFAGGADWLDDAVAYLDGNRRMLAELVRELLPAARMTMPEGTYIALIDLRAYGLGGDLAEWFREHARVAMIDGIACGEAGRGHVRFVFALPRPLLRTAVERMAAALDARAAAS
ncbi:aminotransferase class I/II-fold pyridoxal phosphate-dependent enzyme [Microbacterium sp. zg.Y1090]|uniref:MalY/PatB family protein n=1 Tax=Microbacterium wangruii TaxID=3049073 RepID=UPI00214A9BA3|nr:MULTISPECIES: aminotransferase class I/II-fold pyridoxal phosphate-dependent enzyme [unclassified Microbacterium]MCR2817614.1 aminotransferase class I/II-fold pyridoxal phosphate-dependent enzyme [Microbacterium sp. zg.Y1090]MDL5485743.1 aminotransferase class I/II-fold pyridoxal phosphate-dependent enzyme [Microbacterium sp. zg-Y1211]WIM28910.1 aminotransferase class I/II-fold pyridoxal phosphate-dependent enzyme [Microbacterium sp. zg-Y1090]